MVHLQMNGFIADNMFQYVAARLIAEELGFALRVSHSRMHPERNVPQLQALFSACADAPLELPGEVYQDPVDYSAHIDHDAFDGFKLDLTGICKRTDPRRIEVRGYFQHYDLIRPHKERIRSWFAISPDDRGHDLSANDLVLHIRRGDVLVFGLAMSLGYYTELLQDLTFRRLYIVGCGLDPEVQRTFSPWNPIYIEGSPVEDFRFLLAAKRLVLSNSGFAWWAGFLSGAREIYLPEMDRSAEVTGMKTERAYLWVDDEPRYQHVTDVPYRELDYTLRDIFRARNQLRKKRIYWATRNLLARRLGLSCVKLAE